MSEAMRVFSFGGGVQSTAVLVLAAQGAVNYDSFVFANVGDDSEHPATLEYVERYARPFAERHKIHFVEAQKEMKSIGKITLRQQIERMERSVVIPVRFPDGRGFGNRNCTYDFKIKVVDRFIKTQSPRPERAIVGLGISMDEWRRVRSTEWHDTESDTAAKPKKLGFWKKREYPLIDLRINRARCMNIIADAGLPVPPKSSCFFCPFKTAHGWADLQRKYPRLFDEAVKIEQSINAKRVDIGRDGVFLHPYLIPLSEITPHLQLPLFDDEDACESGYCMT